MTVAVSSVSSISSRTVALTTILPSVVNCEEDKEKGRASGQELFWVKSQPTGGEMLQEVMRRLWEQKRVGEKEDETQLPGSIE